MLGEDARVNEQLSTWAEVARAPQRRRCNEYALVLQAMGIAHGIAESAGEFVLVARSEDAARAREEIERYVRENVGWPPREAYQKPLSDGVQAAIVYAGLLVLVWLAVRRDAFGLDWLEEGRAHAQRIRDGGWWRCLTALTLHVDAVHLVGNIVFGALFGVVLAQSLGSGLAWLCFVVAGGLGNLANAWIQPPLHMSIGASTGVFAALGVQVAYEWMRRRELRYTRWRRWAPFVMGAALLGMLGTGGASMFNESPRETVRALERVVEQTDVMAHGTGFLAGLALGCVLALTRLPARADRRAKLAFAVLAPGLITLAWIVAFAV
jgi:membrane associated rhomboid family serine protease